MKGSNFIAAAFVSAFGVLVPLRAPGLIGLRWVYLLFFNLF
jgi:hypothetical protein